MRRATETVYAQQMGRIKEQNKIILSKASSEEYFDLIVPGSLKKPDKPIEQGLSVYTSALAALEAGTVYNEALVALASGKSVQAIQESVNSVASTVSTLAGAPWIGPVISITVAEVAKARSREQLVEALIKDREITIPNILTGKPETKKGHPIELLLDNLIERVDDMFGRRRNLEYRRIVSDGLTAQEARVAADAMALEFEMLIQYRRLLVKTREYFSQLREVARNPDPTLQLTNLVELSREVYSQAQQVAATLREMR
jgi:hypothetical protein